MHDIIQYILTRSEKATKNMLDKVCLMIHFE